MPGHIRELRAGVWQVMFDIAPDPVTGRRRQRSKVVHGTRDEAARVLDELVADVDRAGDDRAITVTGFSELWLQARRTQLEETTLAGYRSKLAHVTKAIGSRRLATIKAGQLSALYGRLLDQGLSKRSVVHVHRVLRRMCADAVRWGYLTVNPADAADIPTPTKTEYPTWTAEQVTKFLAGTRKDRWWPAWVLAATTGMRRAEICGVRWQDIDLDAGVLWVKQTVVVDDGRPKTKQPKTTRSRRKVALDEATIAVLKRWRKAQLEERLGFGSDWTGDDLVIAWPNGQLVDPNVLSKTFRRTIKRLKLPHIRFHDLRHTWATLALESGVPAKVVADRLGHSSIVVTMDTYTHVPDGVDRDAAEKVARRFGF